MSRRTLLVQLTTMPWEEVEVGALEPTEVLQAQGMAVDGAGPRNSSLLQDPRGPSSQVRAEAAWSLLVASPAGCMYMKARHTAEGGCVPPLVSRSSSLLRGCCGWVSVGQANGPPNPLAMHTGWLKLRGLPFSASAPEIVEWFNEDSGIQQAIDGTW